MFILLDYNKQRRFNRTVKFKHEILKNKHVADAHVGRGRRLPPRSIWFRALRALRLCTRTWKSGLAPAMVAIAPLHYLSIYSTPCRPLVSLALCLRGRSSVAITTDNMSAMTILYINTVCSK